MLRESGPLHYLVVILQEAAAWLRLKGMKLSKAVQVGILFVATAAWLPGLWDLRFLSDDFMTLRSWGQQPDIWYWFVNESFTYYRPIPALFWRLGYTLWGDSPFGYYLLVFALHFGCAILVWHLAGRTFPRAPYISVWSALLFIFLPGHAFAYLSINAASAVLPCSLFFLLSVALYLDGRLGNWKCELLSLCSFILALLSKELALSLPILVCTWEIIHASSARKWLRVCGPYVAVCGAYLLFRFWMFGHLSSNPIHGDIPRLATLLGNAGAYTATVFAPWGLEDLKPLFRARPEWLLAAVGLGSVIAGFFTWNYRHALGREHLLWATWIAVTTVPVLRIFSPWNTYLPSVGSCMLLAAVTYAPCASRLRAAQTLRIVILGACVLYSFLHLQQWRRAGEISESIVEGVIQAAETKTGRIYLANLPGDIGAVPVFGNLGTLPQAIRLRGHHPEVTVLSLVHQESVDASVEALPADARSLELRLSAPGSFFRLQQAETISRTRVPQIGYRYRSSGLDIVVTALDKHGLPVGLSVQMPDTESLQNVYIWNGDRVVSLMETAL